MECEGAGDWDKVIGEKIKNRNLMFRCLSELPVCRLVSFVYRNNIFEIMYGIAYSHGYTIQLAQPERSYFKYIDYPIHHPSPISKLTTFHLTCPIQNRPIEDFQIHIFFLFLMQTFLHPSKFHPQ